MYRNGNYDLDEAIAVGDLHPTLDASGGALIEVPHSFDCGKYPVYDIIPGGILIPFFGPVPKSPEPPV